jgi:hypothetical protein
MSSLVNHYCDRSHRWSDGYEAVHLHLIPHRQLTSSKVVWHLDFHQYMNAAPSTGGGAESLVAGLAETLITLDVKDSGE